MISYENAKIMLDVLTEIVGLHDGERLIAITALMKQYEEYIERMQDYYSLA